MIDYSLSKKLSCVYQNAHPFPYTVIDNFLPDYLLERVLSELKQHDYWYHNNQEWVEKYEVNKFYTPNHDTDIAQLKKQIPYTSLVIDYLNTQEFLNFLKELTGHSNLYCDEILMGGGVHKINRGGKLSIHTDYNRHPETNHRRKLNLLIYLNKNWKEEWGGELELWEKDFSRECVKILPIFNRAVIFDIESAPHGHPVPLNTPDNISRYSLALYYFTDEIPDNPKTVHFIDDDYIFKMSRLK
jgi:Rps23 Pro-64 3,4-dihydroxylase Tpa1-like proline 4-hydroxylase